MVFLLGTSVMKVCKRPFCDPFFLVDPEYFERDLRLPFCGSHDCELGQGLTVGHLVGLGVGVTAKRG